MNSADDTAARVHRALRRAQHTLWQSQRADGRWDASGDMGPSPTAQVLIALHHLGLLDLQEGKEGARWLRGQQRDDGSFVAYPSARQGDLGATACAWAALHLTARDESAEAIARAKRYLDGAGGVPAVIERVDVGDLSAVFLSMAGLLDAHRLTCPPAAYVLIPPLMRQLETRVNPGVPFVALQLHVLVRSLRGDFGPDGSRRHGLARAECAATVEFLTTFQNDDGSWNSNTLQGALALPALRAAGVPLTDDRVTKGIAWLEGQRIRDRQGLHFDAFGSGVWSTAFDVRALLANGVAPSDPRLGRAVRWLVDSQCSTPQPAVDNRQPKAIRTGAWGFQRGNHTMVDCDDVGVVLSALGEALAPDGDRALDAELRQRVRQSVNRGRDWLLGMQNPDGGWPAFTWGLPSKRPGSSMREPVQLSLGNPLRLLGYVLDPPPALGDPSTEDVTGRVLHGLGQIGFGIHSPAVQRAIAFLQKQQCEDGSWWGRWVVNHLSATAFVLKGLHAVGYDLRTPWVAKATRWVLAHQNADGGWGESPDSYGDPSRSGQGPSMAPLTGLVVQGLLDAGEGESPAIEKAVAYLVRRQRADGSWPNDDYLHANIPPETFYLYPEAARFYPMDALARYVRVRGVPAPPPTATPTPGDLDAARQRTDPVADQVIASIVAHRDLTAVNALMATMFRSDAPVPDGLPPEAQAYFEATAVLPTWADPDQIAMAQKLFTRAGWEVAIALFCSSLPQAYAAAKGSAVLVRTGAMTQHLRQRVFETAQFVFDILDEGNLQPGGRGIRAAQKVRLMHAGIRHLLLHQPGTPWDAVALGLPINQEDLAGTLLTFSIMILEGLTAVGTSYTAEEAQAWMHTWKVVGTVLGVESGLLTNGTTDARALLDLIQERQWLASPDGHALASTLVELMESFMPTPALKTAPRAMIRHLIGDHCAELLGLPPDDWTRLLIEVADRADALVGQSARELGFAPVYAQLRQAFMHATVNLVREGKQAPFRIPVSLRNSLDNP